jgi:hypothetical protein
MAADGVQTVALRPPAGVPWGHSRGVFDVSDIGDWLRMEAMSIAMQFDQRNGNSFYSEWLRRTIDQDGK